MSLICETCYIWTTLSPDIKHTVEEGGLLGHAPSKKDTLEGCGCAAVYFGTTPGPESDRGQWDWNKTRNFFYFHG